jgi:hypothetical protein
MLEISDPASLPFFPFHETTSIIVNLIPGKDRFYFSRCRLFLFIFYLLNTI